MLNSLSALPDSSDETIGAAADAAYMAARYRASQGSYAAAAAEYGEVFTARLRDLVPDHPSTLATRHEIARMIGAGGNYAGAEAEYRDVLTARQRILGPDHPDTRRTARQIDFLAERQA
ncbi:tetratricopeptide repeat protein [Nonomuraea sp. M3C6]|uniref:Tetratricopeptide repeat protein n=1 Tax=Nonomuraea marmarensis TaxID=3351344 RepID=A0ABW7ATI7_9ACTN